VQRRAGAETPKNRRGAGDAPSEYYYVLECQEKDLLQRALRSNKSLGSDDAPRSLVRRPKGRPAAFLKFLTSKSQSP
jgi:hypothetical protein